MTSDLLAHMQAVLDWRGPDGVGHRTVVLQRDYAEKIVAAFRDLPTMAQWRHRVRGSVVDVVAHGRAQAATGPIGDMDRVTIYRHNEEWWVRRVEEFEDGRFDRMGPPTEASDA